MNVVNNILGIKPKCDKRSKNKDKYIEKIGDCPKCGNVINNSLGYWWCKNCGYEESNFERAHNIHK